MSELKKKQSNQKTKRFEIRWSENELTYLRMKAKEAGYKRISEYVRDRTLRDTEIVMATSGFIRKLDTLNREVGRIGVNINQVVKAINVSVKADGEIGDKNAKDISLLIREYIIAMGGFGKEIKNLLRYGGKRTKLQI